LSATFMLAQKSTYGKISNKKAINPSGKTA